MHAFTKQEYEGRIAAIKKSMVSRGVDVLFLSDPSNIDYTTGYALHSYGNPQLVIIDLEETSPRWFGRFMDSGGAEMVTRLPKDRLHYYVDNYVDAPDRHAFDIVIDLAKTKKWHTKRIGVEKGSLYFSARSWEVLKKGLPDATFVDATQLVNWIRSVKSEAELKYVREAAVLTDLGMVAGIERVVVGGRQNEAAAAINFAIMNGTPEFGGFATEPPLLPAGKLFSGCYHESWSDDRYTANSAAGLEFSGSRHCYVSPLARTVFLGKPPQKFVDKAKIMIEGLEAMVYGLKAGMTAEEGEKLWRDSAIARGVDKEARIGYSAGLVYPPSWGEGTLSLRPGDRTVLKPNMVLHLIPSLMEDDWGLEVSETVIIGERGAEAMSKLPRAVTIKQ